MSKNPKNWGKLIKIANIDIEFLHIFWMICGNSMKLSGKMCFKIISKVTKNQGLTLSLEDTIFEKPQGVKFFWSPLLFKIWDWRLSPASRKERGFVTVLNLSFFFEQDHQTLKILVPFMLCQIKIKILTETSQQFYISDFLNLSFW